MSEPMNEPIKQPTRGLLLEQEANFNARIASLRIHHGAGFEASSIGGLVLRGWSPVQESVEQLVERSLRAALDPGNPSLVDQAVSRLDQRAQLFRIAVRDQRMGGFIDATRREIDTVINSVLPHMTTKNAQDKAEELLKRASRVVDQVKVKIEDDLRQHYTQAATHKRFLEALDGDTMGPAVLLGALSVVQGRAEDEPAAIDELLKTVEKDMGTDQQGVRLQISQVRGWIGSNQALIAAQTTIHTNVPALGRRRLAFFYLPSIKAGMPVVGKAAKYFAEQVRERLLAAEFARNALLERQQKRAAQQSSGRVVYFGVPEAARQARVDEVVASCWSVLERPLRDLITRLSERVPAETLLDELLRVAEAAVLERAPRQSIDDLLFTGRDPGSVAREFTGWYQGVRMPLALLPGADQARLRAQQCNVLRIPRGSRLKEALVKHASFQEQQFDEGDAQDEIVMLRWQLGCSIEELDLFRKGADDWAKESADPAVPPIGTLSASALKLDAPAKRSRPSPTSSTPS